MKLSTLLNSLTPFLGATSPVPQDLPGSNKLPPTLPPLYEYSLTAYTGTNFTGETSNAMTYMTQGIPGCTRLDEEYSGSFYTHLGSKNIVQTEMKSAIVTLNSGVYDMTGVCL